MFDDNSYDILRKTLGWLLGLMFILSVFAIFFVQIEMFKRPLEINAWGFNNFIQGYGEYKFLFSGTIVIATLVLAVQRLQISIKTNQDKIFQETYNDWKQVLYNQPENLISNDATIIDILQRNRRRVFKKLYSLQLEISGQKELEAVFNELFNNDIPIFEAGNANYIKFNEFYSDDTFSYSFESFFQIFIQLIDSNYEEIERDLKTLYLNALPADRIIDNDMFQNAVNKAKPKVDLR